MCTLVLHVMTNSTSNTLQENGLDGIANTEYSMTSTSSRDQMSRVRLLNELHSNFRLTHTQNMHSIYRNGCYYTSTTCHAVSSHSKEYSARDTSKPHRCVAHARGPPELFLSRTLFPGEVNYPTIGCWSVECCTFGNLESQFSHSSAYSIDQQSGAT